MLVLTTEKLKSYIKLGMPIKLEFYQNEFGIYGRNFDTGFKFKSQGADGGQDFYFGISQRFGANAAGFYKSIGMLGH